MTYSSVTGYPFNDDRAAGYGPEPDDRPACKCLSIPAVRCARHAGIAMAVTLIDQDAIPDDLAPGTYCCRLDESSTLSDFRARVILPLRVHVPGDCLVQMIKYELDPEPVPSTGDESEG